MTVSVLRNQVQYTGNNSTTQFTVNFPFTEKSQVKVYLDGTLQTITTHYTLTDPDSTGTVTFVTAPGTGVVVSFIRETDFLQTVDYANNDILDAETLEAAFDKLTMMCQQVKNLADKSVGFDETVNESETTSLKLASGTGDLAGKLLAFDDSGNFVTTQEIGTFRGNDTTTTTAAYVVRDLIRDSSNDNVYFTKVDAPSGTLLTNTTYFELLVDVETVRGLKVDAETARTGAETALASFQGQYKSSATDPYGGSADAGDLWYDETNSILKYYTGSAFEPVTTSLATVTGNYLTISNQVITAGVVPVSLGGTGSTTASGARTALGVSIGSDVQAYDAGLNDISSLAVTDGNIIVGDGSNWVAESGSTARASLGVTIGSQVQAWDQQLDDISALAVTDGNIIVGNGTTWVAESGATARASLGLTIGTDVEAYSSTNADYSDTTANFTGTLQNGGSNVVVDSDIGSSVQAYDADTAKYDDTTANFTGTLQNGGSNVVVDSDIGSSVQGYDADTAKYDDTTANFTGTLQNGGSNVVVDSDIGSTVQAYDADLSTIAGLSSADGNFIVGSATGWVVESGATVRTSLGLAIGTDVQAYDADTAKYDDTTANFTGTLQNGGSNVLVDSDIGSTVQAAGSYLTSVDLTSNVTGTLPVANGGTGVTSLASLNAADLGSNNGVSNATDGYVLTADGTGGVAWEAATGGSAISNVVEDLSPQLGGNLDVNGQSIVSVSAGNIAITPDTTGKIILDGLSWPTADGTADQVLKTDGAGNLSFVDQSGGGGSGSYIEHANSISDSVTVASGNNRLYIGDTTFSGTLTIEGKLVSIDGPFNLTGTANITGTLSVRH
jgi:hypothetical protein